MFVLRVESKSEVVFSVLKTWLKNDFGLRGKKPNTSSVVSGGGRCPWHIPGQNISPTGEHCLLQDKARGLRINEPL